MGAIVRVEKNIYALKGAEEGNRKGIIQACTLLNAQAKSLAPVDKGQLRNSLMWQVEDKKDGFNDGNGEPAPSAQKLKYNENNRGGRITGIQGTNSDHWYPEFGTRYQAAQPFERPAKEIVLDGGKAIEIAKKYSKEQMAIEFTKRKKEFKELKFGKT